MATSATEPGLAVVPGPQTPDAGAEKAEADAANDAAPMAGAPRLADTVDASRVRSVAAMPAPPVGFGVPTVEGSEPVTSLPVTVVSTRLATPSTWSPPPLEPARRAPWCRRW